MSSSVPYDRSVLLQRLLSTRKNLKDFSSPLYLPTANMGSLQWNGRVDSDPTTFVIHHDWSESERKFETDMCVAEQEFFRARRLIDDEAEESNSVESGEDESDTEEDVNSVTGINNSTCLASCDTVTDKPVELVLLARTSDTIVKTPHSRAIVLEAIVEDRILANDFSVALAMIEDIAHLQSTDGWNIDVLALDIGHKPDSNTTRIVIASPSVSCIPGSIVEVSFTLQRYAVPLLRKERFMAELVSIRIHGPPDRSIDGTPNEDTRVERGTKRARQQ
ncbi:hypothetical protein V5O48_001866 [Marasmius crinis-equi]|uniref:Uncharacterized protein n=1 Tax=Marasmius crinis-equi TaxID=585013 RepID=A0ABR3FY07_9AGAR